MGPCRQLVLELPAAARYTARWCCTDDVARVTSSLLGQFELSLVSVVGADGQKVTSQFAHGPMSKQSSSAEADASAFTSSQSSRLRKKRMSYNVHSFTVYIGTGNCPANLPGGNRTVRIRMYQFQNTNIIKLHVPIVYH